MILLPVKTDLLRAGDNLAERISKVEKPEPDDILVVSSKAVAVWENAFVDLDTIEISTAAQEEAKKTGRSPGFCQAVLNETRRMNGRIAGHCPGAILCVVHPADGVSIVAVNAGMDESNVPEHTAVGWPHDPVASAQRLQKTLGCAVIIIDSCCIPIRSGISAYALACSGIDPIRDERGKPDLFGKLLRMTRDAIADELAAAASLLMGNAAQATPAVLVREHGFPSSDFAGWIPTIAPEADLFRDVLRL